ncbi:penicillin-binding protein 1C [Membranihabitans marinus]
MIAGVLFLVILVWISIKRPLFNQPHATVITDVDGRLLAAKIASDGQWRFPEIDSLPSQYITALRYFEDEYFFYHPGVNPISFIKAIVTNLKESSIKRGASTITMQLVRLSRENKPRTYVEKLIEIVLAIKLEFQYTKTEILKLYASHAPFGGNVVGISAASWRYFGREPRYLSWAEAASLAVLPNAPSLIFPGKNQTALLQKRNRLLNKLYQNGEMDRVTYELALAEELPQKPFPLPQFTPHLLQYAMKNGTAGQQITSTINRTLQSNINQLLDGYHQQLSQNHVHNAAVLVLDIKNNTVISYVGNTNCKHPDSGRNVDIIQSLRSTGSTLKPFLYGALLDRGKILPETLVADIPTRISGYVPQNFNRKFDGAVTAQDALTRSLNIPAVRLLQEYGTPIFCNKLEELELTSIDKGPDHYGLSLILGGAESSLWELCQAYAMMARKLNGQKINKPTYINAQPNVEEYELPSYSAFSIYQLMEILTGLERPDAEGAWNIFDSSKKIAWKTGTSFGQRDAWAIGLTPEYVVGVWAGNADGEGRPGLTGIQVAAPIMFNVWSMLPATTWFSKPHSGYISIDVCSESGYRAGPYCSHTHKSEISYPSNQLDQCPFHQQIFLDSTLQYRVNSHCYPIAAMEKVNYFILPRIEEYYYKAKHPNYKSIPRFHEDCMHSMDRNMELVYPKINSKIFIPKTLDGSLSPSIFEVVHRIPNTTIYWYIDHDYLGQTRDEHKMEIIRRPGKQVLTLVDEWGNTISQSVEFIEK